jgi:hypothetical protein
MNAFKEWMLVCEALGSGAQSIILRKGGIAEGRAGFSFAHVDFLLFPTLFHEQIASLRVPAGTRLPEPRQKATVEIRFRVRIEWTQTIEDLATARRLGPFHVWRDEVIEERFHYKNEGRLHLACVRVATLEPPHCFPDAPRYGGCRSWVQVPDLPVTTKEKWVLDDAMHQTRVAAIRDVLGLREPVSKSAPQDVPAAK